MTEQQMREKINEVRVPATSDAFLREMAKWGVTDIVCEVCAYKAGFNFLDMWATSYTGCSKCDSHAPSYRACSYSSYGGNGMAEVSKL